MRTTWGKVERLYFAAWNVDVVLCAAGDGRGAPGPAGSHPAGAGGVSGPPGVHPGAAQVLCKPHTLQCTELDQWVRAIYLIPYSYPICQVECIISLLILFTECLFLCSFAGGCKHRRPRAGSAGSSVQRLQTGHWEAGRHPWTAQQTQKGRPTTWHGFRGKLSLQ